MAGKRQHHLWQMLQRGFSWEEHGDHHIWVYREAGEPERTVTRTFGRLNQFYGPPGSEADENITRFENATQGFIQEARQMRNGQAVDRDVAAVLVAHLETRSFFLRDELSRVIERAMALLNAQLTSREFLDTDMPRYIKGHPEVIDALMGELKISTPLRPILQDSLLESLRANPQQSALKMAKSTNMMIAEARSKASRSVKDAHNKALTNNFHEMGRANLHRSLTFSVMRSSDAGFILPDTSLAFFTQTGCKPLSDKDDKVEAVIVPLSVDTAIIGKRDTSFQRDMTTLRRALAGCAYECFIAPRKGDDLVRLSKRISRNAKLLTDEEIKALVRFDQLFEI